MANPFATATEIKVLELLKRSAGLYGLELVHKSGGTLKRGTIYVILGRLAERGLVNIRTPSEAGKHAGLPRPIYIITEAGVRMLKAWQQIDQEK